MSTLEREHREHWEQLNNDKVYERSHADISNGNNGNNGNK